MKETFKNSEKVNWSIVILLTIIFAVIKSFISIYMKSPFIFSDEQSYFGMIDKIANLQFSKILNSHMPGYPLILTPFYKLSETSIQAYHIALIINSIMGALVVVLAYYLFRYVFKIEYGWAVSASVIVALSSSFYAYNYTVMSETLQSFLYFLAFVIICDLKSNTARTWKYFLLGMIIGYLPIVKIQAVLFLGIYIVFTICYQFTKGKNFEKKKLLFSGIVAVIEFLIFRHLIFRNVGLYEETRIENIQSIFSIFSDKQHFLAFTHISLAELAYFFVATGLIPCFFVIVWGCQKIWRIFYEQNKEELLIAGVVICFILGNIGITVTHAYFVYTADLERITVYARYLDFFQSIVVAFGLYIFLKNERGYSKWTILILGLISAILCFGIYPTIGKIDSNTYSVKLFSEIPVSIYAAIFLIAHVILYFCFMKNCKGYLPLGFLLLLFFSMDISAIKIQLYNGESMVATYHIPFSLANHPLKNEQIILDEDFFGKPLKEDSTNYNGDVQKNMTSDQGIDFKYSMLFWLLKDNDIFQQNVNKEDKTYICTNKMLTRKTIQTDGNIILYDKKNQTNCNENADIIFRTSESQLEFANADALILLEPQLKSNLFVNDVENFQITINFASNIVITTGENDIQCYVNDIPLKRAVEENDANRIVFQYEGNEPITIESLRLNFGGKYQHIIEDRLLYIISYDISYN